MESMEIMPNSQINIQKIMPGKLSGSIKAMPSKSLSHRALIAAALTRGNCIIDNISRSHDVDATAKSLVRLGIADINFREGQAFVSFAENEKQELYAGESASTLRLLIPLTLLYGGADFMCSGRLPERPLTPYMEALHADFYWNGSMLHVKGELDAGTYGLDGSISSQFVSGLLIALPLLREDSMIGIKGELQSKPYADLTVDTMRRFGVEVRQRNGSYVISGNQTYKPANLRIEGDWSHAAFYFGSNSMGSSVLVEGLDPNSLQGDRAILDVLNQTDVDLANTPDLFPILAVTACARSGRTRFYHTERLRLKESDRLQAMAQELNRLGADVSIGQDQFIINGRGSLKGGTVFSHGDHRVAMALAIASAITDEPIILHGSDAVQKSAPLFWDEFLSLGGKAFEYLGE